LFAGLEWDGRVGAPQHVRVRICINIHNISCIVPTLSCVQVAVAA